MRNAVITFLLLACTWPGAAEPAVAEGFQPQQPAPATQPSALSPQSSVLSPQPSALGTQHSPVSLLERYPTTLTRGTQSEGEAQVWSFAPEDIYRLTEFYFRTKTSLRVETGDANLGIGHCADGAVWAVIIPLGPGMLEGAANPQAQDAVESIWLRFHPSVISEVFPPETVRGDGDRSLASRMRRIANAKLSSSWHYEGRAVIPERHELIMDLDTIDRARRMFMADRTQLKAAYLPEFANMPVPAADEPLDPNVAVAAFSKLTDTFEQSYPCFAIRGDLDWDGLCARYREKFAACSSKRGFAELCAEMLASLKDPDIAVALEGTKLPVFDVPQPRNANPFAQEWVVGQATTLGTNLAWHRTDGNIGFIEITGWNDPHLVEYFDQALDRLRDTSGLIIDVRQNHGGDEGLAAQVAGRFITEEKTYAYQQRRSGPGRNDLGDKMPRSFRPRGPWAYEQPVVVLIGPRCAGTTESFAGMMDQCPKVTLMGIHTAGANGDPASVRLLPDVALVYPQRLELRPDGQPLSGRGVQPDVPFEAGPEQFLRRSDALLAAAVERLTAAATASAPRGEGGQDAAGPAPAPPDAPAGKPTLAGPPRVVEVSPADGTDQVDPVTEIRIRFDRPMKPELTFLDWIEGFFVPTGTWRYLPKTHGFVLPVELKPFEDQRIALNPQLTGVPIQGFQSEAGVLAERYEWSFKTRRDMDDDAAPMPQVIAIEPPAGSVVGRVVPVQITFDQPMAAGHFHGIINTSDAGMFGQPYFHVRSAENGHRLIIPLALAPDWSGTLEFQGFRSRSLAHAENVSVSYTTGKSPFSPSHLEQIRKAGASRELLGLIRQMRDARAGITALEETIRITRYAPGEAGVFTTMQSAEAVFRMDGDDKFYGDASQMLNSPFIVGSDGQNAWCYSRVGDRLQVASCPIDQVYYRTVIICDPFHTMRAGADAAIAHMKLEYLGTDTLDGRPCRVVQGWYCPEEVENFTPHITRWWIDSDTFLPVQAVQEWASGAQVVQRFEFRKINEPMTAADFVPPAGPDIRRVPPEPLGEEYNARFLHVVDASVGRMSVRWGRTGSAGTVGEGIQ